EAGARAAARQAMVSCFFVAGITGLLAILVSQGLNLPIAGFGGGGIVDAGLFLALGFGVRAMSRFSAVAAFVLYIFDITWMFSHKDSPFSPTQLIVPIAMITSFISGIRGTFAYHSFCDRPRD